jgi:ABC-type transport system involved in cytochrome c biogenesis ATPase subunit
MPLNDEILKWSRNQHAWQQDGLRRIFANGSLTTADLEDLFAIASEDQVANTCEPLQKDHLSGTSTSGAVRVLAIKNMQGINAFPAGREIGFARDGLTVVFGENGAGKSGYARVLKRACRARYAAPILGNAFLAAGSKNAATADLHFEVDGAAKSVAWTDGRSTDEALASVVVYDSQCAGDYIEAEGQPTFQPFGLRALNELSRACKFIEDRVAAELAKVPLDATPFSGLAGTTSVGNYLSRLGKDSDTTQLRNLGAVSEAEHHRLRELGKILSDSDPEPKAKTLERLSARLAEVASKVDRAELFVSPQAMTKLAALLSEAEVSALNRESAKSILSSRQCLAGTGGDHWRPLIEAARNYSTLEAYPDKPFPNVDPTAWCVLCQAPLTEDGRANLGNYAAFSSSDAFKKAAAADETLMIAKQKISNATSDVGLDDALRAELGEQGLDLVGRIEKWIASWEERRGEMTRADNAEALAGAPAIPSDAANSTDIRRASEILTARAKELRDAKDPAVHAKLTSEHRELTARISLSPHVPAIERYVENARRQHDLNKIRGRCSSLSVSRKMTELADTYLTDELLSGMKAELTVIGYSRSAKHRIPKRTAKGVTLCRVELDGSAAPVDEVLSEGEQRATAFAYFMAEVRLNEKQSTLVFDDPVTSLDHRYRRKIAERLAALARDRQVIIFTHDAVFLTMLNRAAAAIGSAISARHVAWDKVAPGLAIEGLGWDVMGVPERISNLRQRQARLKKEWGEYPTESNNSEMADAYGLLRGTMERAVRDSLLNEVMLPYSDEIKVEAFEAVIGMDPAQWEKFLAVYDRACEAIRGHDTSAETQAVLPTPDQLAADLDLIKEVVDAAKARRAAASQKQTARGKERRKGLDTLASVTKS